MSRLTHAQLFDLTGKVALVTGGAMGIGQGIAYRLAEAGACVMISDINMEAARQTVREIKGQGGKARAVKADVRKQRDGQKAVRTAVGAFGRLDILVNNAGIYPHSAVFSLNEEIWDDVFDTNVKGMFFYSQAAAQQMIQEGHGGKIINLASTRSFRPMLGLTHYAASKSAIVLLTQGLALELARHGILVNAIAPGGIRTPGTQVSAASINQVTGLSPEEMSRRHQERVPLGRRGEPDDMARIALFLASPASDYVTGSVIVADAGYLLS